MEEVDVFTTDGMIVRNQKGDCMGIFSTVNFLNSKIQDNERLKAENKKLRKMVEYGLGWEDLKNE